MIRPITEADTPVILSITASTGVFKPMEIETLAEVIDDYYDEERENGHRAFVWEEDGQVIGFLYHAPEEMTIGTWCLWWIVVAADQQGRGLGATLLAFVEQDIRDQGGRLLIVETADTPRYEATRRFYLNRGYTIAAHVPDYYLDDDGMVVFTKRLLPKNRGQKPEDRNHCNAT